MKLSVTGADRLGGLPEGYRQTGNLHEMGERAMDMSNEAAILTGLRALDGVTEGVATYQSWRGMEMLTPGDWYHVEGAIVYRCALSTHDFNATVTRGYYRDERDCPNARLGYQNLALDLLGVSEVDHSGDQAILEYLIEIRRDLDNYPVLDDDDYEQRCLAARVEMVQSSAPVGVTLTDDEAEKIVWALMQDSWPPPEKNEAGILAKYQVEWSGDSDHHVYGIPGDNGAYDPKKKYIDLSDCVTHAMRVLYIRQSFTRRRKRG